MSEGLSVSPSEGGQVVSHTAPSPGSGSSLFPEGSQVGRLVTLLKSKTKIGGLFYY